MVNHQACKNTGYSREELLRMSIPEIDLHATYRGDQSELWHKLETGQSTTIESIHTRKDGTQYPVEIHLNSIVLDGRPAILPVVFDISQRKQVEEALRQSENYYRVIFETSGTAMFISEENTIISDVNSNFEALLGYSRQEVEGKKSWTEFIHPDDVEWMKEYHYLRRRDPRAAPLSYEFRFFVRNGELRHGYLTADIFPGTTQSVISLIDITERHQAEQEKEKLHSQLAQAQKMESVGRLAGGVAHDFNNMLSIINGYAELALEMIDPADPVYKNIRDIHTAGKRSEDIVKQLLAFARRQTISPARVDLNDTIANMLRMLQRLIGENIELAWHPGNNLWPVKIDSSQLDQVMANLAVNARDAISDVGRLTIETKNVVVGEDHCRLYPYFVPGRYVLLVVTDSGCGMEKQVQENLFEPFFTTKETGKGTGLGLSTIYGVVKQNKGFINVYSEPGLGTTFKIYLPCHEEQEAVESRPRAESTKQKQMPTGSETLLLVEDEPAILFMGREILEKLGYTVLTAEKPAEALRLADENKDGIHLLITDVIMPEMNGRDLAARLSDSIPGLKTIYMSGYTADVIASHGVLEAGVEFIQKPFSLRELAVKVRQAIDTG